MDSSFSYFACEQQKLGPYSTQPARPPPPQGAIARSEGQLALAEVSMNYVLHPSLCNSLELITFLKWVLMERLRFNLFKVLVRGI